jgi:SAM-dependent methyltransferase
VARKRAAEAGVKLNALRQDAETFEYGSARWDLIVLTYEPFPLADPRYAERLMRALKPGGLLVIETFASDAGEATRRPVDLNPAALLRAFQSLRIRRFEDTEGISDWANRSPGNDSQEKPGPTRIVRLVAEKQ